MEQTSFLRSTKEQGGKDPIFDKLTELGFPILDLPKCKGEKKSWSRPYSPIRNQISSHTTYQVLALHKVSAPPVVNFLPYLARTIMVSRWAATTGPLALTTYHPLPTSSRKNFPKFLVNGNVAIEEHIKSFFMTTHILGVAHEDVAIRLFVETLTESASDYFINLDDGSITNWDTMRISFETRFKTIEDEHVLLT